MTMLREGCGDGAADDSELCHVTARLELGDIPGAVAELLRLVRDDGDDWSGRPAGLDAADVAQLGRALATHGLQVTVELSGGLLVHHALCSRCDDATAVHDTAAGRLCDACAVAARVCLRDVPAFVAEDHEVTVIDAPVSMAMLVAGGR